MLGFLAKPLVGQIAGPLCAALLALLLMARCDNAVLRRDLVTERTRSRALQLDLNQCRSNGDVLQGAIDGQNVSLSKLEAAGRALEAQAAKELAQARKATEAARRASSRLLRPLMAPDQCSRVIEADKRVLEGL